MSARPWPMAAWAQGYRRSLLVPDSIGALTAWALIVPECVAYAQIAGVPVQNAFYAAPVALIAYALFGTSRFLVVGATSAAAVLSNATVAGLSTDPQKIAVLSAALALISGAVLIVAGLARLGFLADFLAEPALVGFLFGMALTIAVRQLAKLVGVSSGDGNFFARLGHILSNISHWSVATLAVGVVALAGLLLLERFIPRLPASLVVLAAGIAVSAAAKLESHGVEIVGKIPRAIPTPAWPDLPWHDWVTLAGGAVGLALVVFAESFSISSGFAREGGDTIDASREMTAMGAANAAVGLFRGFAVSGSASRSAAAKAAGAGSPMVSVIAAGVVLLTGAFLTPLFTDLPEPVLGAIVVVAIRSFFNVGEMRRYWRQDRWSFAVAATALVGVLVFDLLPGLLLAVALSLAMFIGAASRPRVSPLGRLPGVGVFGDLDENKPSIATPGLLAARPDAALFFGNATRVAAQVNAMAAASDPKARVVVLDLGSSYHFGVQVLDQLDQLRQDLDKAGAELWLARVRAAVRPQLLASPVGIALGPDRLFPNVDSAADAFTSRYPAGRDITHPEARQ